MTPAIRLLALKDHLTHLDALVSAIRASDVPACKRTLVNLSMDLKAPMDLRNGAAKLAMALP